MRLFSTENTLSGILQKFDEIGRIRAIEIDMTGRPDALKFECGEYQDVQRFPQPAPGERDWYAYEALRMMPRIILMVDRNRFSDTYGCFDREFWHYRTVDFPCAMNQEFCLPLALAYKYSFPNNPYQGVERLRELVIAAIRFAEKITHRDGSCDDYFPFERALGANVFTTYAMTESYLELELQEREMVEFFRLRGQWLINNEESGQLSNHQALAALALYNVYTVTGERRFLEGSNEYRDVALSWQHDEGWFQEYEGADPGYHSCSISFLAKLWQKSQDASLIKPLQRAVEFASYFLHPDGSYAGEYGSRNSYHFYPHGFEVLGVFEPTAHRMVETYLQRAMPERRRYFNDDNRMCAHYVYEWMYAWRDYHPERDGVLEDYRESTQRWFEGAQLFVTKRDRYYAVVSASKGGCVKVFDQQGPVYSDTGLIGRTKSGEVLVSHLIDEEHQITVDEERCEIIVEGVMSRRRHPLPSPVKQMLFRIMNLSVGRLASDMVRFILQKVLITGTPRSGVRFRRRIRCGDLGVEIDDTIDLAGENIRFEQLAVGSDATSIYVAASNIFQESNLLPWLDLSELVGELNGKGRIDLPTRHSGVGADDAG